MAKATCKKHKRFVPTCDPCKSAALRETVGFPGGREEAPPGPTYEAESESPETVNDIPDYEPDEEEAPPTDEPSALASALPAVAKDIDETEEAMEGAGEFDPDKHEASDVDPETPYVPEAETIAAGGPVPEGTQMSPLEMAMLMFPQRLTSQGITPFIEKALFLYLEAGLMPEDAVICVASEVIHAEHGIGTPDVEEVEEAFEAGVEAAPEITGCIEDYNQGHNDGMSALHRLMLDYYAGDEDTVAYEMMRWVERQMKGMKK